MSDEPTEQEIEELARFLYQRWAINVRNASWFWIDVLSDAQRKWLEFARVVHARYAAKIAALAHLHQEAQRIAQEVTCERDEARDEADRLRGEVAHEIAIARNLCDENDRLKADIAGLRGDLDRLRQPPPPKENPMEPVDREQFAELLYYLWYRLATTPWEKAPDKEKKQVYRVANSILAEFAVYARTPDEQLEQAEAERRSDGTAPLPPEPQHGWRFNPEWTLRRHAHRHDGPTKRERVALAVLPMLTDRFPRKSTVAEAVADCFAVADAFLAAAQQPPAEPTPPPTP